MARVKMLRTAAGVDGVLEAGRVYPDVSDDFALALVEAEAAELMESPQVERAIVSPPETAAGPAQRSIRRGR